MKKSAMLLALPFFAGAALGDEPTLGLLDQPGGSPMNHRDTCWDQPADLSGNVISCEIIGEHGLVSEVANDFSFDADHVVTQINWVSGMWGAPPGGPPEFFNILFYEDDGNCTPVLDPYLAYLHVEATVIQLSDMRFDCTFCCNVPIAANTRTWVVCQIDDHEYPPQYGHCEAADLQECESCFRSEYFGYPDWAPCSYLIGVLFDGSLILECDGGPSPAGPITWGEIKSLYR